MNKFLEKNISKIVSFFILLQPILDLITGLCVNLFDFNITVGIIIRILFLALIMYVTTFVFKKKLSLWIYISIIFYSILYLVGIFIYKDGSYFTEVQGLVKAFYFPILLISLYEIRNEIKISSLTLVITLFTYLICIFIPSVLNIGFKTYQIAKIGTLGFYNSANEISGIISLLTPIMFILILGKSKYLIKGLMLLVYLVVILMMGTKTPLLSLCITLGTIFMYYFYHCIKKKTYKPIVYSTVLILVGFASLILVLPKTNFYKNIEIHLDYLEVDNVFEVFTEYELVDHFIFSQRLTFLEKKNDLYLKSSAYEKIFGIGYTHKNKVTKAIEMDYFDIFYSHGMMGFALYFGIYLYVLSQIFKTKQKTTYTRCMQLVALLLIIVLSMFTGHIITGPAVSLIAAILIIMLAKRNKKDILFTAVNFDIGGIEKALVNLLNRVNYDKYNVDVVLEEKTGLFLPKIISNANITELKVSNNKNIIIRKCTNLYRKLIFTILNYQNYDFSCCFATYSYSSNKLALLSSSNNAFYIHSNYTNIYKDEKEFRNFFDSRNISKYKRLIFVSNEAKKDFTKIYNNLSNEVKVINNFIDIDYIKMTCNEKIDIKKKSKNKLFVFVGRLEDHSKKLTRALNLVKEIKDIELWIIGDGPDKEKYEEYVEKHNISSRVKFLGKKANPYPYMNEADYIILTSDYEGFPVTYLEAIVLNKNIITTIDVSDDAVNIGKDYAFIVSKDEKKMVNEVKEIIKKNNKVKAIDLNKAQELKMLKFEEMFDEVI